jgi:hypothetical protein
VSRRASEYVGSRSWLPRPSPREANHDRNYNECISMAVGGKVIAAARFNRRAAADGQGSWIVSCRPARLFTR